MWFRLMFDSVVFRGPASPARPKKSRAPRQGAATRLLLEVLEERTVPSFLPPVDYAAGQSPNAVAAGDFTNNHIQDLVACNHATNTVSLLLGNGDGTFRPARFFATGTGPDAVAVGDFNGDGKLDIVTTNWVVPSGPGTVSVLLGNGDGSFQAPVTFAVLGEFPPGYTGSTPLPQDPFSVAVGDMNHDGRLDLVVTAQVTFPTTGTGLSYHGYVDVLLGHGDGTFAPATATLLNVSSPQSVALADLTGKGNLDVATVSPTDAGVCVLLGNGDGTLGAPTCFATGKGTAPDGLAVGDVNGDGKLDLVTPNYAGGVGGSVSVLMGNGDGSFQAPAIIPLPAMSPGGYQQSDAGLAISVGDLNGDGKLDLAVTASWSYSVYTGSGPYGKYYQDYSGRNVNVLLGHGDGTFTDADMVPLNVPVPIPSPRGTSTATPSPTWRWPTPRPIRSRC